MFNIRLFLFLISISMLQCAHAYYITPSEQKIPLGPKVNTIFLNAVSQGDIETVVDMLQQDEDYVWNNFDAPKIEALQTAATKLKETSRKIAEINQNKKLSSTQAELLSQLKQQQEKYYNILWKVHRSAYNVPADVYKKIQKDPDAANALKGIPFGKK